jgi:hypothetical protein
MLGDVLTQGPDNCALNVRHNQRGLEEPSPLMLVLIHIYIFRDAPLLFWSNAKASTRRRGKHYLSVFSRSEAVEI